MLNENFINENRQLCYKCDECGALVPNGQECRKCNGLAEDLKASVEAVKKPPKGTIKRDELARLAFTNSKRLPKVVNDGGIRKRWVGIGWVAEGKARGGEVVVEG